MTKKFIGKAFVILSVCMAGCKSETTALENRQQVMPVGTRLRGFTVQDMDVSRLETIKTTWHANSVRVMLRPNYVRKNENLKSREDGWDYIMQELPAYLDAAKALNVAIILDLHGVPNNEIDTYAHPDPGTKDEEFWSDEKNLKVIIQCWRQMAALCAGRDQLIWYDIFNEPNCWKDFPKVPQQWPDWAQRIIDGIRKIDPETPIVVESGPGGLCWGFKEFPLLAGTNIIYSCHSYQPIQYTHQGVKAISLADLKNSYPIATNGWPGVYGGKLWNKESLENDLKPIVDFQKKHNVRVYIGEVGVSRWAPNASQYLRDSLDIFEKYGWDWSYHSFRESPIWSLEHNEMYTASDKAQLSTNITDRGQVVLEFFERNNTIGESK